MFRDIKKPAVLIEAAGFLLSKPSSDVFVAFGDIFQARSARPKEKPYRLFDGGGLYLQVTPTGSKFWRMKFRQPGSKENRLSFGVFPEVSLADARARRDQARQLLVSRSGAC